MEILEFIGSKKMLMIIGFIAIVLLIYNKVKAKRYYNSVGKKKKEND